MRKTIFIIQVIGMLFNASAQVGINTTNPDPSSILEINSSHKGVLLPRVGLKGTNDTNTIENPAESLIVYNTQTEADVIPGFYYWSGSSWVRLSPNAAVAPSRGVEKITTNDGTFTDVGTHRIWTSAANGRPSLETTEVLAPYGSTTSYITIQKSSSGNLSDTFTCSKNITSIRGYVTIQTSAPSTSRWRVFLYVDGSLKGSFWGAPPNGVNNQRTQCVFEYGPVASGSTVEVRIDENTLPTSLQNQASYFMVEYEL